MFQNRKATFKQPAVEDSQQYRRQKALDEQKRRRAKRVDSTRQLDLFADMSLGNSDEEEQDEDVAVVRSGIAGYASLLPPASDTPIPPHPVLEPGPSSSGGGAKKKKKWKQKAKRETLAMSGKWADQCMYAELLEMSEDNAWNAAGDGLPDDLETGWVAVAPVPVGKRCLVVSDQSLGVAGVAPNTSLRSRKLGKLLMPRFPSTLPPSTVLDCILDTNWRENGILHILDVHRWKGQDIGECETPFRFWWRDTRIAELPSSLVPSSSGKPADAYRFPYPIRFLPIPYHTDTTLPSLLNTIVPLARSQRTMDVQVPAAFPAESEMLVEPRTTTLAAVVPSDGLLLYVSEASYEPGTSPLSSWIPLVNYDGTPVTESEGAVMKDAEGPLDVFSRLLQQRIATGASSSEMDIE
ncbi:hypothetical protein MKEN_00592500 [Mycena kentingensis (nom. inval.)]|nr:hypothetical protein MKEN_00592500 [Mycena kentingensis (nom. inval.)]